MSLFFAPIALVLFLAVIGVIVGLIVLLVRSKPAVRWIIIAAIAVVMLPVMGVMFLRATVHRDVRAVPPISVPRAMPVEVVGSATTPPSSDAWQPTVDKTFVADVYPSPRAAAQALARKLVPLLIMVTRERQAPSIIELRGDGLPASDADQIVADMAEVLRSKFNAATVRAVPATAVHIKEAERVFAESMTPASSIEPVNQNAVSIVIDMPNGTARNGTAWDANFQELAGPLRAHLRVGGSDAQYSCNVSFIHKPWVDDYATFISARPNGQWLRARSSQFAVTQHEAAEQALRAAAEVLSERSWTNGLKRPYGVQGDGPQAKEKIVGVLIDALRRGNFVVDKFAQRLSPSYGEVWRQAILLDVSPDKVHTFIQPFVTVQHVGRTTPGRAQAATLWSLLARGLPIAGLVAFICVVYAFLKLATNGRRA